MYGETYTWRTSFPASFFFFCTGLRGHLASCQRLLQSANKRCRAVHGARAGTHGFKSLGLSMRLTSANLRVFFAFPMLSTIIVLLKLYCSHGTRPAALCDSNEAHSACTDLTLFCKPAEPHRSCTTAVLERCTKAFRALVQEHESSTETTLKEERSNQEMSPPFAKRRLKCTVLGDRLGCHNSLSV